VNIRLGAALLSIFLITWYAAGVGGLLAYGYHIKLFGPVLLACTGFALVQATRMSRQLQMEKMESNKTLGLSYQGQGMLDMACEKYMQCPVGDGSVKNLLYNLGLDFERKRMFNKAAAIYEHIRTDGAFKDIGDRITRLKAMDNPLAMSGGRPGDPTLKMDDTTTKPTFGRYEIVRELGHGAMGTVYLGQDPKINRKVAIKTLEYDQVQGDELDEVKERFFREAEAVGKLSHPNIVSIYDVGEEHDMAYIAMELLTGENLTGYCHPDRLLSVWQVLSYISDVTAALDYAHQQGVVHRDIKPGNIMLLEDGRIKVTDFGIARVIDASRTRTGVILGTPSYMSPEQVAGKNVDGRSDLFSLGVVFYQLLTGTKPFKGENITAILYAITHHAYAPLSDTLPDIPSCIGEIVDKLLSKGVTKRFQSAAQLTKALKACKKAN
jgi:eukaryotic-like serine/threonine-protein kinase